MKNAFNTSEPTEYKKLTDNGNIQIEYGAKDFVVKSESYIDSESEVLGCS
jgi:hypothetical protein